MAKLLSQTEKYHLLNDSDDSLGVDVDFQRARPRAMQFARWLLAASIGTLFTISIILNIVLLGRQTKDAQVGTKWANLVYNVPTPIYSSTEYGPAIGTEGERDRRWEALDISEGIIAMPDDIALEIGLPLSERFPWDQSQGVYLLGAHHQIHCLKRIYEFTSATHQGRTSTLSYEHILHCLDNMLQDAYCHADDTPWMQLPPQPYRQKYAEYQTRQCKSWDQLMTWARQFNACYKNENITDANGIASDDPFEHFKYCPENSPHTPLMEKFFEQRARGINATEAYNAIHNIT